MAAIRFKADRRSGMAGRTTANKAGRLPVLLALETATTCGSVALVNNAGLIGENSLKSSSTHSRRLLTAIEWLLRESSLAWPDIDGIAVSLGPGSFTGLRIGLSTAKGLAMAAGVPLFGIGTLDGLAAQLAVGDGRLVCPVLDARKQEVYAALYRGDQSGQHRRVSDYMTIQPEALCRQIKEPVVFLGDGIAVFESVIRDQLGSLAMLLPPQVFFPRAAVIGSLALAEWQNKAFLDPAAAVPIYVRASEAELNLGANNTRSGAA